MLPTDPKERKATPIYSGVVKYFPRALAEVARVSKAGNDQHNPGQPLHWDKTKSADHGDCAMRHLIEAGTVDTDGQRHSAKLAWRALALLEMELSQESEAKPICGTSVYNMHYWEAVGTEHLKCVFCGKIVEVSS